MEEGRTPFFLIFLIKVVFIRLMNAIFLSFLAKVVFIRLMNAIFLIVLGKSGFHSFTTVYLIIPPALKLLLSLQSKSNTLKKKIPNLQRHFANWEPLKLFYLRFIVSNFFFPQFYNFACFCFINNKGTI